MARSRWRVIVGLASILVACAETAEEAVTCPPSPWRSSPPLVIAHAGGEGLGPANTLVAMERSLAAGADLLDVDLRMTRDGVVVATHDRDVATTTDGAGNVDELTWAELRRLDASAGWTGPPIGGPVRIPSLEQVLTRFPTVRISLELKQVEPPMTGPLCDVLRRTTSVGRVYASANEDRVVYAARDACPGLLITTTYADLDTMRSSTEGDADWCAASPIGQPPYGEGRLDAERVAMSHRRGTALFVWTVDDADVLRELATAGVDAVYTRRPDIARAVFDDVGVVVDVLPADGVSGG
ncbi:MAG: hypothetical protein H0U21_11115 [Acidimicrobiia bacterium]|nr:hypothetical protein [Acidimicrobiia bacterium]